VTPEVRLPSTSLRPGKPEIPSGEIRLPASARSALRPGLAGAEGVGGKPDSTVPAPTPLEFVCEEDVRLAIQAGRKLLISERAIVTPAARDLAEAHRVITFPSWRG
jgi:hypothetical protein